MKFYSGGLLGSLTIFLAIGKWLDLVDVSWGMVIVPAMIKVFLDTSYIHYRKLRRTGTTKRL